MTHSRLSISALAALTAFPAAADVTALDVWDTLRKMGEDSGMTVSVGGTETTADALVLTNVRYGLAAPEASVTVHFDQMSFAEGGDGTVMGKTSDAPISISFNDAESGALVELVGVITLASGESTYGGSPDALSVAIAYPSAGFSIDNMTVDGEAVPLSVMARLTSLNGAYEVLAGAPSRTVADYTVARVVFDMEVDIPEEADGGGRIEIDGVIEGMAVKSNAAVADMKAGTITEAFDATADYTYDRTTYDIRAETPEGDFSVALKDGGGSLGLVIADGVAEYDVTSKDMSASISSQGVPMPPIEFTIAEQLGRVKIPLLPSADEREFGMELRLTGLQISDLLWSMVDPFGGMPHDPADIALALSGTGKLSVNVFDPNFDPETMNSAPGELSTLSLDDLLLRAVGVEVTAKGAVENKETNPLAMPKLAGGFDISAKGVQGLMATLGQMGMLPAEQAGMVNMMLGMFAVPGAEPDSFTSRIQITEDGGILANGQRVR